MTHQIAIIGLGYVGLPLARLFATKYPVVGFDINQQRIAELNAGNDFTLEVEEDLLKSVLVSENPVAEALEATLSLTLASSLTLTSSSLHGCFMDTSWIVHERFMTSLPYKKTESSVFRQKRRKRQKVAASGKSGLYRQKRS